MRSNVHFLFCCACIMSKTILIIPYRDRQTHLDYFLKNSLPKIKNIIPNVEVLIVEQIEGKKFNRGAVINIGYNYYNQSDYYYITQDVDTNPNDTSLPYYAQDLNSNEILSIYSYSGSVGGIAKFKGKDFIEINGFPNDFWGWGHEDKDFKNRILFYNKLINRIFTENNNGCVDVFLDNHNREDSGKYFLAYEIWDKLTKVQQEKYIVNNGLSTLKYDIIKEELLLENVKKITVDILCDK